MAFKKRLISKRNKLNLTPNAGSFFLKLPMLTLQLGHFESSVRLYFAYSLLCMSIMKITNRHTQ